MNNVYTILCSNGIPTTNPSVFKPDKAKLIYKIVLSLKFNFGELVFRQVLNIEAWNDLKFLETFKKYVDEMECDEKKREMKREGTSLVSTEKKAKLSASA